MPKKKKRNSQAGGGGGDDDDESVGAPSPHVRVHATPAQLMASGGCTYYDQAQLPSSGGCIAMASPMSYDEAGRFPMAMAAPVVVASECAAPPLTFSFGAACGRSNCSGGQSHAAAMHMNGPGACGMSACGAPGAYNLPAEIVPLRKACATELANKFGCALGPANDLENPGQYVSTRRNTGRCILKDQVDHV